MDSTQTTWYPNHLAPRPSRSPVVTPPRPRTLAERVAQRTQSSWYPSRDQGEGAVGRLRLPGDAPRRYRTPRRPDAESEPESSGNAGFGARVSYFRLAELLAVLAIAAIVTYFAATYFVEALRVVPGGTGATSIQAPPDPAGGPHPAGAVAPPTQRRR